MPNSCGYDSEFHKYKPTGAEWHHPISSRGDVGGWLCEYHHSIICGRKNRSYFGEMLVNKRLNDIRNELKELERKWVFQTGANPDDIDKH
jgi:hypothetical protein